VPALKMGIIALFSKKKAETKMVSALYDVLQNYGRQVS
jgi:hypothetical protein